MGGWGERIRFWLPVIGLAGFAVYSGQKLIRAHVDREVSSPDYYFTRALPARRGSIYSSFGKEYPFAKSVPYWDYHLDPVALTNAVVRSRGQKKPRQPKAILKTIADALRLNYGTLRKMGKDVRHRYQPLATSTDPDVHGILADSTAVAGVTIEDEQVRQYLHGRRLCHVLGAVNAEHVGSAGIELRYEKLLAGTPGTVHGMKDARGRELYDKRITSIDPIPGADVYLTIDHNIQFEVEDALKWGVNEFGAGSGWSLVLDSRTGAILAMASLPDYDPKQFGKASESARLNRAIAYTYEPGSVMKVITASSAIDAGFTSPNRLYNTRRDDPNYYKLPGDGSHVWDPYMSVRDAIVHSSNIVIGKLGYDFGPGRLFSYMREFGFGCKTGVELPGEEVGILWNPKKHPWDKASMSRVPIGQAVSVTAIQLASAYQAIANDGVRMKPYIVEKVVESGDDGIVLYQHQPTEAARPIRASTARTMRGVMLDVASAKGTARRAAIRGYSVAGKTGTAQKALNGHYVEGLFRATFCGIVPASEPRLVILVTLDFDQKVKFHQGGNSSGPVFKRIAMAALRYLSVEPDRPDEISEFDEDEFEKILDARAQKYGIISDQ